MLDLMRKHARSWLIKAALLGVCVVFVLFFGWPDRMDRDQDVAAKVNNAIISPQELRWTYDRKIEIEKRRFGDSLTPEMVKQLKPDLGKEVIEELIDLQLLCQEAERLGFAVTEQDLRQDIANHPMFQRNGIFNESMYRAYLKELKLPAQLFEQRRKQELLQSEFSKLIVDSVKTDPQEIRRFWQIESDKIQLAFVMVKPERPDLQTPPDQEKFEAYFKENRAQYEIPASVDLEYVQFSWKDVQANLSVSEEEARSYFSANPAEFVIPEKVKARHILLEVPKDATPEKIEEVRQKIEQIRTEIQGGKKFDEMARSESQDKITAEKGGDLGFIARGSLNPKLENVLFNLKVGELSEPLRTPQGYHLILVEEQAPEKEQQFEEVKDSLISRLVEQKARKKAAEDAEEMYERAYRTENLEDPAKELGITVHKATGATKQSEIADLGSDPKIFEEALALAQGQMSRLIRSGDRFVILRVLQKSEPRLPELDEVRHKVLLDYAQNQALLAARKKAAEIIDTLKKSPDDPDGAAKKYGLRWEKLNPVSRVASTVPKLGNSPEIKEMLTYVTMAVRLFPEPITTPDGVAIVKLENIEKGSDERFGKESAEKDKLIRSWRQAEFWTGWIKKLRRQAEITINDRHLKGLLHESGI